VICRHSTITLLASLALALGIAVSTAAATTPSRSVGKSELQRALDRVVATGVPGAIALVRDGDRTIRLASGSSNLEPKTPMRTTDRFRIGSVTKTFIATVVLQLVGEGKLSLDDSVERRLPGLVPNGRNITIRQLLNMTSGLYDYLEDPRIFRPYLAGDFGYAWSPEQLAAIGVSHEPLFAPGKGWSYSNTNYILLGLIVEKATRHSLGAELARRIFAPLHLRSTSFDTQPRIAGRHAHGYYRDGKTLLDTSLVNPSHSWAAGAIVSTADDVASFYRALSRGRLLRPELLRAMRTTVAGYGLGLGRLPMPCGTTWGHAGKVVGYTTDAWGNSDGRRQVVVFANLNADSLSRPSKQALNQALATAYCGGRQR
jgi:D-alanyl-D-alanine carboxypeptidase